MKSGAETNPALTAVAGIRVGHASVPGSATGCTVVLGPFRGACDVRGPATGSRELDTLSPRHLVPAVDAILLTGGSAFGLEAAGGVMSWLAERGAGFETGHGRVPIVPAAVIFDLGSGGRNAVPGPATARAACEAATGGFVAEGAVGAGTGATVGKLRGAAGAMPGGVGTWAASGARHTVGALAVVNAFGDVLDSERRIIAGALAQAGEFLDTERVLREAAADDEGWFADLASGLRRNTTLVVVATDAPLNRPALQALAMSASVGVARRVAPAHSAFDGDITFALSTAKESRELPAGTLLALSVLAIGAVEMAIERAVRR